MSCSTASESNVNGKSNVKNVETENKATTVCNVHVADLRRRGYTDIVQWMAEPNNVYVGRRMRLNVYGADGSKKMIHLTASPFANKFKNYPLEESLALFRADLVARLDADTALREQLIALRGKCLGCWCAPKPCHADIVRELANSFGCS